MVTGASKTGTVREGKGAPSVIKQGQSSSNGKRKDTTECSRSSPTSQAATRNDKGGRSVLVFLCGGTTHLAATAMNELYAQGVTQT